MVVVVAAGLEQQVSVVLVVLVWLHLYQVLPHIMQVAVVELMPLTVVVLVVLAVAALEPLWVLMERQILAVAVGHKLTVVQKAVTVALA
jgi:hypothetical protein